MTTKTENVVIAISSIIITTAVTFGLSLAPLFAGQFPWN